MYLNPLARGMLVGTLSAASLAATGALGAAILSYAGFSGLIVAEAAKIGAMGGGMFGFARGMMSGNGFFEPSQHRGWVQNIVEGAIGFAAMNAVAPSAMSFASTVAAFVVGTPVMALAGVLVSLAVMVCGGALLLASGLCCSDDHEHRLQPRFEHL